MDCCLCKQPVTLFDLDDTGYAGLPAHTHCAVAMRALLAETLADAEAMILAEPDRRRHRHGLSPAA